MGGGSFFGRRGVGGKGREWVGRRRGEGVGRKDRDGKKQLR